MRIAGVFLGLPIPVPALVGVSLVMAAAWARQRRTRNAGIVDVLWTACIGSLALAYAALETGWAPRRALVAVLAGAWALRLTVHLARRVAGEPEDGRYAELRERMGAGFDRFAFGFFQAQALLAWLLALVFWQLCRVPDAGWRWTDGLAVLLWSLSIAGETRADRQLAAWRRDPAHRGRTCRSGLWRWSRHPNYFFEWLHWLVYPLLGVGLPGGAALWLAPAAMLLLVLRVTGIPPTERRALLSRGDDYRDYQRTTSAFLPWPPGATPTLLTQPR